MASKRKRKLEKKSSKEFQEKMQARRASANDALWTYGLPLVVILVVGLGIYFAFFLRDGRSPEQKNGNLKILSLVRFTLLKTITTIV